MIKKFFILKNFQKNLINNKERQKVIFYLKKILIENSQIIKSLGKDYTNSYDKKKLTK